MPTKEVATIDDVLKMLTLDGGASQGNLALCWPLVAAICEEVNVPALPKQPRLAGRVVEPLERALRLFVNKNRLKALSIICDYRATEEPRQYQVVAAVGELFAVPYDDLDNKYADYGGMFDYLRRKVRGVGDAEWRRMEKDNPKKKLRQTRAGVWLRQADKYSYRGVQDHERAYLTTFHTAFMVHMHGTADAVVALRQCIRKESTEQLGRSRTNPAVASSEGVVSSIRSPTILEAAKGTKSGTTEPTPTLSDEPPSTPTRPTIPSPATEPTDNKRTDTNPEDTSTASTLWDVAERSAIKGEAFVGRSIQRAVRTFAFVVGAQIAIVDRTFSWQAKLPRTSRPVLATASIGGFLLVSYVALVIVVHLPRRPIQLLWSVSMSVGIVAVPTVIIPSLIALSIVYWRNRRKQKREAQETSADA